MTHYHVREIGTPPDDDGTIRMMAAILLEEVNNETMRVQTRSGVGAEDSESGDVRCVPDDRRSDGVVGVPVAVTNQSTVTSSVSG